MIEIRPHFNAPQAAFLTLDRKFKAFVGGFGCLRGDTQIVTEFGPMRIADIDRPMRVLSWSETSNQFRLSLSGGAFPKGRANLYRVVTQHGEFVANGSHRVFCAGHRYQSVEDLSEGQALLSSPPIPPGTSWADALRLLPEDAHGWTQIDANLMGRYADTARQYGQRFLQGEDSAPVPTPSPAGVHTPFCNSAHEPSWRGDDPTQHSPSHNRLVQPAALPHSRNSERPDAHPVATMGRRGRGGHSGHTQPCNQRPALSPLMFSTHRQAPRCPEQAETHAPSASVALMERRCFGGTETLSPDYTQAHRQSAGRLSAGTQAPESSYPARSFECSSSTESIIVSIERLVKTEPFYDMQVSETNNYVSIDGTIHHNSGKTWVGCAGIGQHFYQHPRVDSAYFAPTYPQIRDIFYPTVEESLAAWGLRTKVRIGDHEVEIYRGKTYLGKVLCRSMEDPGSIVGFKIGHALVDEIDVLPLKKATDAWRKILARMRATDEGLRNGIDVATTPEGFRFAYNTFVKALRGNETLAGQYGLVQASTYENEKNLPADYIPSLLASYPPNLIDAYINGQFVNLQTGTVYSAYDRKLNRCADTVQDGEPVHIGVDFNVGKMAGIVHVKRGGLPRAVDEIVNGYDTPDMIRKISDRFWKHEGGVCVRSRSILIYPDASGGSRKSVNASETDIALLKAAGFTVRAPAANPPVKDRVNAMNGMFLNSEGERRYLVNDDRCPTYADCLEQQAWTEAGEPDKSTGHDHPVDAGGYFISFDYPIIRRIATSEEFRL